MLTSPLVPRWLTRSLLESYKTRGDDVAVPFSQLKKIMLPFSPARMALLNYSLQAAIPGSIPDDDGFLRSICGKYVDENWTASRDAALAGWLHCEDGNYYHPELSLAICISIKHTMYLNWRALRATVGRGVVLSEKSPDLALAKQRIDDLAKQIDVIKGLIAYGYVSCDVDLFSVAPKFRPDVGKNRSSPSLEIA